MKSKIKLSTWNKYYSTWLTDCRKDLKNRGYDVTRNNPEIWENGSIRWKGTFICSQSHFVTAWRDSKHYRDTLSIRKEG